MADHLPLLDLSPLCSREPTALERLTAEVDHCLITDGFLLVVGHQVPSALRAEARAVALEFFHLLDAEKQRSHVRERRGWLPTGFEATGYASGAESLPDLKETLPPPASGGVMYEPVVADEYISEKYAEVTL